MVQALFVYEDALQQAHASLSATCQRLTTQALKEHDDALLDRISTEKTTLDEARPGRETFRAGTHWRGSRFNENAAVRTRMAIGKYEGNTFLGRMHRGDNPEDEWIVEGTLDGKMILFHIVQMVRRQNREWLYQGYLVGDWIILKLGGTGVTGEPVNGFVELNRG